MKPSDIVINNFADSCYDILRMKLGDAVAADLCDALAEMLGYIVKLYKCQEGR